MQFVVQRQGLDADGARISLDCSTIGRAKFEERVPSKTGCAASNRIISQTIVTPEWGSRRASERVTIADSVGLDFPLDR